MSEAGPLMRWDLSNLKEEWSDRASRLKRRGLRDEAHEVKTCAKELEELMEFFGERRA